MLLQCIAIVTTSNSWPLILLVTILTNGFSLSSVMKYDEITVTGTYQWLHMCTVYVHIPHMLQL